MINHCLFTFLYLFACLSFLCCAFMFVVCNRIITYLLCYLVRRQWCSGKLLFGGTPPPLTFPSLFLRSGLPLIPLCRLGQRCKLPQRGPGQSPGHKRILEHFFTPETASGDIKFLYYFYFILRCPKREAMFHLTSEFFSPL